MTWKTRKFLCLVTLGNANEDNGYNKDDRKQGYRIVCDLLKNVSHYTPCGTADL